MMNNKVANLVSDGKINFDNFCKFVCDKNNVPYSSID